MCKEREQLYSMVNSFFLSKGFEEQISQYGFRFLFRKKVAHRRYKQVVHIVSFLTKGNQYVKINNISSRHILVSSCVPQGSHSGPILFDLFINDFDLIIKTAPFVMLQTIYKYIKQFFRH